MTIEQQVCSLELAKRLKELGVKQESYFSWVDKFPIFNDELRISSSDELERQKRVSILSEEAKMLIPTYSAFTTAELGEMLPQHILNKTTGVFLWISTDRTANDDVKRWEVSLSESNDGGYCVQLYREDTEADARAKMLIYLIEQKLITL